MDASCERIDLNRVDTFLGRLDFKLLELERKLLLDCFQSGLRFLVQAVAIAPN